MGLAASTHDEPAGSNYGALYADPTGALQNTAVNATAGAAPSATANATTVAPSPLSPSRGLGLRARFSGKAACKAIDRAVDDRQIFLGVMVVNSALWIGLLYSFGAF